MKRLPIIVLTLALCLLTAGCGAKPNEPDDGDSAKAEIVERMATVTAEEIKYVPSFVADVSLKMCIRDRFSCLFGFHSDSEPA